MTLPCLPRGRAAKEEAEDIVDRAGHVIAAGHNQYTPFDFWDDQPFYVEIVDNPETGSGRSLDDPRHPDHRKFYVQDYLRKFGAQKCEANALVVRQREGRMLSKEAILRYLPGDAIAKYQDRLEVVREEVRQAVLNRMGRQ